MRVEELEKEQKMQKKQQDKKIKDLENLCKVKNMKESEIQNSKILENNIKTLNSAYVAN